MTTNRRLQSPNFQPPTPGRARRGVLLLVVLSLLVLFALIGITFVLVAGQHLKKTKMALRNEQQAVDPRRLADAAMAQIVRGTTDLHSVVRSHSLLEDLYGNDGVRGVVLQNSGLEVGGTQTQMYVPPAMVAGDPPTQLLDMQIDETTLFIGAGKTINQIKTPGYLNGCVLTMLDGPAANLSTRIVGSGVVSGVFTVRIMAFDWPSSTTPEEFTNPPLSDPRTDTFLINGRPFNGTGFGFNPIAPTTDPTLLNADDNALPMFPDGTFPFQALMPNPVYFVAPLAPPYPVFGGIGGADEGYDAADPQNMALAYLPLVPPAPGTFGIIPSFHRPDLIWHYGEKLFPGTFDATALDPGPPPPPNWKQIPQPTLRRIMLRPMGNFVGADHPEFTGSNPLFNPINGPFDVDNDGDGISESVWIDVGLPVQTAADGRTFKPLVAALIVDLDSRLNVNAHGNVAHVDQYIFSGGAQADAFPPATFPPQVFSGGAVPNLTRGQGYGPPEVNLYPLFTPIGTLAPPNSLLSAYGQLLAARYEEPNTYLIDPTFPYDNTDSAPPYASGMQRPSYPGISFYPDLLAGLKMTAYPFQGEPYIDNNTNGQYDTTPLPEPYTDVNKNGQYDPSRVLSAFGSPYDLRGQGFVALDARGMPLAPYMNEMKGYDTAYELNLNRRTVRASTTPVAQVEKYSSNGSDKPTDETPNPDDSPFTAAELEGVLRIYDIDASQLPDRLRALLDGTGGPALAILRGMVTTDSFDLPSPDTLPTRDIRAAALGSIVSPSISDLLRVRLLKGGFVGNVDDEIKKMLPPEVIGGQRMDINRPFGNGMDDREPFTDLNGNGVYDAIEPYIDVNGNGVFDDRNGIVDEPDELETGFWGDPAVAGFPALSVPLSFKNAIVPNLTNGIDLTGDNNIDLADKVLARHLYARHLYVLMMLLKDETWQFDLNNDGTPTVEETAEYIAQWAINVVDFRDRDSIMTPFEYDTNPFDINGWSVDGDPATVDPDDVATVAYLDRGLVWGCERPELLITETLAFHDRRTEDLGTDSLDPTEMDHLVSNGKDTTFDQRLLPRGSLFVEIYNPWVTPTSTVLNGPAGAAEAPEEFSAIDPMDAVRKSVWLNQLTTDGDSPVWRLLIVDGTALQANNRPKDPDDSVDPPLPAQIERSIYFVDPQNTITTYGLTDHGQAYYQVGNLAPLLPGRYGVVGSTGIVNGGSHITTIGRLKSTTALGMPDTTQDGYVAGNTDATRRIVLTPNVDANSAQVEVLSNGQSSSLGATEPSLTDIQPPIAVVIDRTLDAGVPATRSVSISEPVTGYGNPGSTSNGELVYATARDTPLDDDSNPINPQSDPKFRYIHLQRLADPTSHYDATTNPYRTIDTAPVPLVVINGVADESGATPPHVNPTGLSSTQRGINQQSANYFWGGELAAANSNSADAMMVPQEHNFDYFLFHSLGYLNEAFGTAGDTTSTFAALDPLVTTLPAYKGAPKSIALPWLTWNNRPFVGPMELLLVPRSRSSQLFFDYATLRQQPYGPPVPVSPGIGSGHLPDFFEVPATPTTVPALQLHRIFGYLQVPSRFVGTETYLNPTTFSPPTMSAFDATGTEQSLMSFFHPPFNKVSNYRDPGRVNVNTISSDSSTNASSSVWNGILNSAPGGLGGKPLWSAVYQSRQGAAAFDPLNSSTSFANPFRSAAGASLLLPNAANNANRDEVDVTLMRPLDPNTNNAAADLPLFDFASANPYDNSQVNPYFRIQNLQRLSNLLTTRSNVYAIWLTVGYFEVTPGAIDTAHLDGYRLGQEVGIDTGEVKRHRAFYIYDRSIPVGFEPGQDHNFEDGLLLRRFIE